MSAKILVVDDNQDFLKLIQAELEGMGYTVVTSDNGVEGIRLAESLELSLILLDVMMPAPNGYDVCKKLKENPQTSQIPIIILSAMCAPNNRTAGLQAGANDFVAKPYKIEQLQAKIQKLIKTE